MTDITVENASDIDVDAAAREGAIKDDGYREGYLDGAKDVILNADLLAEERWKDWLGDVLDWRGRKLDGTEPPPAPRSV